MAKIFKSSILNTPIEQVWDKIRDFNALPDWHPGFVNSYIENDKSSGKVGCVRNFNLKDGGNIRERLLTLSDIDHLYTYTILDSPFPMESYVSTLRLLPISDGNRTYIEWTAEFNCSQQEEENLVKNIGDGVFQAGFNALKITLGA